MTNKTQRKGATSSTTAEPFNPFSRGADPCTVEPFLRYAIGVGFGEGFVKLVNIGGGGQIAVFIIGRVPRAITTNNQIGHEQTLQNKFGRAEIGCATYNRAEFSKFMVG